jgi:hypothetical protein
MDTPSDFPLPLPLSTSLSLPPLSPVPAFVPLTPEARQKIIEWKRTGYWQWKKERLRRWTEAKAHPISKFFRRGPRILLKKIGKKGFLRRIANDSNATKIHVLKILYQPQSDESASATASSSSSSSGSSFSPSSS